MRIQSDPLTDALHHDIVLTGASSFMNPIGRYFDVISKKNKVQSSADPVTSVFPEIKQSIHINLFGLAGDV